MTSSAAEKTWWSSLSSISCLSSTGLSTSSRLSVTFGGTIGSLSDVITFDLPSISICAFSNVPVFQSRRIGIDFAGLNFAQSDVTGRAQLVKVRVNSAYGYQIL